MVLSEALTGEHRRDFHTNRLLRTCQIGEVDEPLAREAARLRSATGRAGTISAVDALVAAEAGAHRNAVVLTSDPVDLRARKAHDRADLGRRGVVRGIPPRFCELTLTPTTQDELAAEAERLARFAVPEIAEVPIATL